MKVLLVGSYLEGYYFHKSRILKKNKLLKLKKSYFPKLAHLSYVYTNELNLAQEYCNFWDLAGIIPVYACVEFYLLGTAPRRL